MISSAQALLGQARGVLAEAEHTADVGERFRLAHLAALRIAAAVLAAKAVPAPRPPAISSAPAISNVFMASISLFEMHGNNVVRRPGGAHRSIKFWTLAGRGQLPRRTKRATFFRARPRALVRRTPTAYLPSTGMA